MRGVEPLDLVCPCKREVDPVTDTVRQGATVEDADMPVTVLPTAECVAFIKPVSTNCEGV